MINQFPEIPDQKFSEADIQSVIAVLTELMENSFEFARLPEDQKIELLKVCGRLSRPYKDEITRRKNDRLRLKRQRVNEHQRAARKETGIRAARDASVFVAPRQIADASAAEKDGERHLVKPVNCYVCKALFTKVHFFYDSMCPECAAFNYAKRFQTASLDGQTAFITGARVKIGFQSALMMLRAGARVIVTTRFPVDAARRYAREEGFAEWKGRLHIYGLDLRHTPSVELFCDYIESAYDRLDILINNAAQTVRRPPGFYAHMMKDETTPFGQLPADVQALLQSFEDCKRALHLGKDLKLAGKTLSVAWNGSMQGVGINASAQLSQVPYVHDAGLKTELVFPSGEYDADLQQVDKRATNSWRLKLGEIATAEMIELQLVNAIAPFVLCNRLSTMMKRENTGQKHIVNVSAMEGKFHRFTKTDRHPHTNMAKAALNMLTHTSASDLAQSGIYMNAVDTGWVTDEDPLELAKRKEQIHDFQPPLDIVDGAARVCDPFFDGILRGQHWSGKFLKDYFPVDW